MTEYENWYAGNEYYWGVRPSPLCLEVLKQMPVDRHLKLIDVGCGEGRNAVFFARNGFDVSAFDLAQKGVDKTNELAKKCGVPVKAFSANMNEFQLEDEYDVIFSTGVLQNMIPERRQEIIEHYKQCTKKNGLHAMSVFVHKPFIGQAPDWEESEHTWVSGELMTCYKDWKIEYCTEDIFDCQSSGVPHQHAMSRVIARRVGT